MRQHQLGGLTPQEFAVLQCTAEAWNRFIELPKLHRSDRAEFMRAIHAAQNIVMSRPTYENLRKQKAAKRAR